MKIQHLVFYDGACGICDLIVSCLYKADNKKIFGFAPLQGETAREALKDLTEEQKQADTMILIENYKQPDEKIYIYGQAAFRTAWLIGGWWTLAGWLYFVLPAFITDPGYRFFARNRHLILAPRSCQIPDKTDYDRFLP